MSRTYSIGVDTGGTYTDAVIVASDDYEVMASAKSLTTHGELSVGVSDSLEKVLKSAPNVQANQISRVCLSTTLATNALVEGRGSSLAVILIGFDDAMVTRTQIATAIPEAYIIRVTGGHKYDGSEAAQLDADELINKLNEVADHVEAFAIASHYAVRNPSHERQAEEIIRQRINKPVSASCDLSDSLDGPKRALTAAFNARIISLIVSLQEAVSHSMERLNITAPIMIVKGDGSVAEAKSIMGKPIETILSGPAASVIGAGMLSAKKNFVVSDIGGTTTDVATVTDGWPATSKLGASVGGYQTLVKAIALQTMGLGGDSAVSINDSNKIEILSHRVIPISMLGYRWPHIVKDLELALSADSGMRSALQYLVVNPHNELIADKKLSTKDLSFLNKLDINQPIKMRDVVMGAADRSSIKRLIDRGLIRPSGYTPTDAAHVLGLQNQWSKEAAVYATELIGRASYRVSGSDCSNQLTALAQEIFDVVVQKSSRLLLEQLSGHQYSNKDPIINSVIKRPAILGHLKLTFQSTLPLVSVGGPAAVFYPEVAKTIHAKSIIPKHSSVANAIGAAVTLVKAESRIEITMNDAGHYLVHHDDQPTTVESGPNAIEIAKNYATDKLKNIVRERGGRAEHIEIDIERIIVPDTENDRGLISAVVVANCLSVPTKI